MSSRCRLRLPFALALFAGALIFSQAGCRARTQIMLGVITDLQAPDALDEVEMVVRRDGQEVLRVPWTLPGVAGEPYILPGSYGVYTEDGSEPQIAITVTGLRNGQPRVERRALVSLVRERTLFLRLGLVAGCVDRSDCAADETCVESVCRPMFVDARRLPEYEVDMEKFVDCASGTTFIDTGTHQPVPTRSGMGACTTPGSFCQEATCYLPIPDEPDLGAPDMAAPADLAPALFVEEEVPPAAIGRRIASVFGERGPGGYVWAVGENGLLMQRTYFAGPMAATAWVDRSLVGADAGAGPDLRVVGVPPESSSVWFAGVDIIGSLDAGRVTTALLPRPELTFEAMEVTSFPLYFVGRDAGRPAGSDGVVFTAEGPTMVIEDTSIGLPPALRAVARLSSGAILVAGERGAILVRDPGTGSWRSLDARFLGSSTTVAFTSMATSDRDIVVVGTSDGRVLVLPPGAPTASVEPRFSTAVAAVWIGDATARIYAASVDGRIDSRPVNGGAWVTEPDVAPRALAGLTVVAGRGADMRVVSVGAEGLVWSAPGTRQTLPPNPPPMVDGGTAQCFIKNAGGLCSFDCDCLAPLTCHAQGAAGTTKHCCTMRGTVTFNEPCLTSCDCADGECMDGVCSVPN
jgi:hypothetical protein